MHGTASALSVKGDAPWLKWIDFLFGDVLTVQRMVEQVDLGIEMLRIATDAQLAQVIDRLMDKTRD
jgi:hypothetical protein